MCKAWREPTMPRSFALRAKVFLKMIPVHYTSAAKKAAIRNGSLWDTEAQQWNASKLPRMRPDGGTYPQGEEQSSSAFNPWHIQCSGTWQDADFHIPHLLLLQGDAQTAQGSMIFFPFDVVLYCQATREWLVSGHLICNNQGQIFVVAATQGRALDKRNSTRKELRRGKRVRCWRSTKPSTSPWSSPWL